MILKGASKESPRISVRIQPVAIFNKLKKKYRKRGEISHLVNKCLNCVLNNPGCLINKGKGRI